MHRFGGELRLGVGNRRHDQGIAQRIYQRRRGEGEFAESRTDKRESTNPRLDAINSADDGAPFHTRLLALTMG